MNSLIFLIFYIVLRMAMKDWEESLNNSTPKRNNTTEPFSKNNLKNNGRMRRFSYPECYVNDIKIQSKHIEFYMWHFKMNNLNIHYINELHKVYISEDESNENISTAGIIYLIERVNYVEALN